MATVRKIHPKKTLMPFGELGTPGLKHSGGFVIEEFHQKLRGGLAVKAYREMADNSSTVGAFLFAIRNLIRGVNFKFVPVDDSPAALAAADFFNSNMEDMSHTWDDFIAEVLSMLEFGWAYFEVVYKRRSGPGANPKTRSKFTDGKIGWRKFAIRSQESLDFWEFDKSDGGIRGMWQNDPYRSISPSVFIPIEKALLFRTESRKNNPEGRSLLRTSFIDYQFMKRIRELEAISVGRDITGVPKMEVPIEILASNPSAEASSIKASLEKQLAQLQNHERVFVMVPSSMDPGTGKPTGYKFEVVVSGGKKQMDTNAIIMRYQASMLRSVLAQFMQLGEGHGSFALSSSQTDLFAVVLGAILESITTVIERFAVSKLGQLNGIPQEVLPTLTHSDLEKRPVGETVALITSLSQAGILSPNPALEDALLETAGLPTPDRTAAPPPIPPRPVPEGPERTETP